jgi:hypothetical protein
MFHSDDWGLVGIRDHESFKRLRHAGLPLGTDPLDYHSCETAADLAALYEVLSSHRDSVGNPPIFVCAFVLANVEFSRVVAGGFRRLDLKPLHEGLPTPWASDDLVDAYRRGVASALIYPALHGVTHFCRPAVEKLVTDPGTRGDLLRLLFREGTPVAYPHTPWVGFEFKDDGDVLPAAWLPPSMQEQAVAEGVELFQAMFGRRPLSACAPGYQANPATFRAYGRAGIHVVHNGPGVSAPASVGRHGLLHLFRNVAFEPAWRADADTVDRAVQAGQHCVEVGKPIVIYTHSTNYHSSVCNYRERTLEQLDRLLSRLEDTFDDLLYVHDGNLWDLARTGEFYRDGKACR